MNRFRFRSRHRCSGARAAAPWLAGAAALLPLAGFLHPVSGADHAVAMVAVGLWGAVLGLAVLAAQIGTASGRALLLVLPIGWLTGVWIGLQLPGEPALPLLTTLSFTLVGLLVALQARLGVRWLARPRPAQRRPPWPGERGHHESRRRRTAREPLGNEP
jgi:urease accessory protein